MMQPLSNTRHRKLDGWILDVFTDTITIILYPNSSAMTNFDTCAHKHLGYHITQTDESHLAASESCSNELEEISNFDV